VGLIVGIALGGLLLMTAVTSLRTGELRLGDRVLRRGELRFGVAVGLIGAAGLAAASTAVIAAEQTGTRPSQTVTVPGFSFVILDSWQESEAIPGTAPPGRDLGVVAFAGAEGELVVTWRRAPAEGSPEELLDSLRQPGLRYDRWERSEIDGVPAVDMEYASPRGIVRARALALHDDGGEAPMLRWALATCTHEGRARPCEDAVASLKVVDPVGPR